MSSAQRWSRVIPIEYAQLDGEADGPSTPRRPGVKYTQHTLVVPSDRRVILIPASIQVPEGSRIVGVILAPNADGQGSGSAGALNRLQNASASSIAGGRLAHHDPRYSGLVGPHERRQPAADVRLAGSAQPRNKRHLEDLLEDMSEHIGSEADDATFDPTQSDEDMNDEADEEDEEADEDAAGSDFEGELLAAGTVAPAILSIAPETGMDAGARNPVSALAQGSLVAEEVVKPKKPRNSFFYFRREYHKQTNANGARAKAKNISNAAGKTWKEMTEEEKAPYKKYAAEDTLRYKSEMKEYKEALKIEKKKSKMREKAAANGAAFNSKSPQLAGVDRGSHGAALLSLVPTITMDIGAGANDHISSGYADHRVISVSPVGGTGLEIPSQALVLSFDQGDILMDPAQIQPQAQAHSQSQLQPQTQLQAQTQTHHQHQHQHQQGWDSISSILDGLATTAPAAAANATTHSQSSPLGNDSFFVSLSEPGDILPIQLNTANNANHVSLASIRTARNSTGTRGRSRGSSEAGSLTGIHPSIPDIEIVDATNSISLQTYSIKRRK